MRHIDTTAIALKPIEGLTLPGYPDLNEMRPVVMFARQGLEPSEKLAKGGEQEDPFLAQAQPNPISLRHHLDEVIFLIDSSLSMGERLDGDGTSSKEAYLKERFYRLTSDYFGDSTTKVSLISFNADATLVLDGDNRGISAIHEAYQKGYIVKNRGTNIAEALSRCNEILSNRLATDPLGARKAVVILTDGDDTQDREKAATAMRALRAFNVSVFIGGIGSGFNMNRVVELAGEGGASMWGHVPIRHIPRDSPPGYFDLFDGFLPRVISDIQSAQDRLSFEIEGQFTKLSAASRSLFPAPVGDVSILAGYVPEAKAILFSPDIANLKIKLSATPHVGSTDVFQQPLEIVKEEEAGAHFELLRDAKNLLAQWLLSMTIREGGRNHIAAGSISVAVDPEMRRFLEEVGGDRTSTRGTVKALDVDTVLGTVRERDRHRGKRPNQVSESMLPENDQHTLHSGNLGWLDAPASSNLIAPPVTPDPAAYRNQPGGITPAFTWTSAIHPNVNVSKLLRENLSIIIGRHPDCQVQIANNQVSRFHCELSLRDGLLTIKDLDSANGTYIGTRKCRVNIAEPVMNGARIRIGPSECLVTW